MSCKLFTVNLLTLLVFLSYIILYKPPLLSYRTILLYKYENVWSLKKKEKFRQFVNGKLNVEQTIHYS